MAGYRGRPLGWTTFTALALRTSQGAALAAILLAVLALLSPAPAGAAGPKPPTSPGSDASAPPRKTAPSATGAAAAATTASSVTYQQYTQRDENGVHYVLLADQQNVCVWGDTRHGADITIPIKLDTFLPIDSQGYPAPGNPLYNKQGRLELVLYDIDDKAGISPPERDWLYWGNANAATQTYDTPVGLLSGVTDALSTNAFSFPLNALKPKSALNPTGLNDLHVDVDTGNNGGAGAMWCAGVNEVILRLFSNEPLPAVLVHGFTSSSASMQTMKTRWGDRYPALRFRMLAPDVSALGGVWDRYPDVDSAVQALLQQTGQGQVNLVGHSFGGLTVRHYALNNPDLVRNVAMLGAPNGGDRLADIACIYLISPSVPLGGFWSALIQAAVKAYAENKLGKCEPDNAIFQMTTPFMQGYWNASYPDPGGPKYWALGGDDSSGFTGWLASQVFGHDANDGLVTVKSALWLRPSAAPLDEEPSQPGNHQPIGVYHLKHSELRTDAAPLDDTQCKVYPETCGSGPQGIPFRAPSATRAGVRSDTRAGARRPDSLGITSRERRAESRHAAGTAIQALAQAELETGFGQDLQLAAGETKTVPLSFEGSPNAVIVLFSDHPEDLSASFAGTQLGLSQFLDAMPVLGLTLSPASNGTLTVTNNGTAAADVRLLTNIETTRRMTVAASPKVAAPNAAITFTVTVDDPDPGDAPHLSVMNEAGQIVKELDPTSSGTGTWTGTWTPGAAGSYHVQGDLPGARPRSDLAEFTVASGAATVGSTFTEQAVDENGNGLYDVLVARPAINATVAGSYLVSGTLKAADGKAVASASAAVDLVVGSQTPALRFDGRRIYASGKAGPYRLVDVTVTKRDAALHIESSAADLGATAAYAASAFEHDRVSIDRSGFSDQGVDTNSDGLLDQINVTVKVTAETAGTYYVSGELAAPDGAFVASREATVSLAAGSNTFTLAFFGSDVGRAGKDGPYSLRLLAIESGADPTVRASLSDGYKTSAYTMSQFAGPDVTASASVGGPAVTLAIPSATRYGRIAFSGTAGKRVSVELTGSTLSGEVELRGVDNRVLASVFAGSGSTFLDPVNLGATGSYTLVVDPSNTGGGSITVRLYDVPADATASITPGGAAVTVTTTVPGQNARLTFTGSAGQRVSAKLASTAITSGSLSLYAPDGTLVGSGSIGTTGGWLDTQTLGVAGTYTLIVDPSGAAIGGSTVTLYNVPADVSTTIRTGRTVTVTTTVPGQNAKLTFTGAVNDQVTVGLTSTAITSGSLSLVKPDGTTLASTSIGTSGAYLDKQTLPLKGTYTILVDPAGTQTGAASVTLNSAADVTGTITPGGAAVTKSTTVAGQNIRLTFTGSANQAVSVKVTSTAITSGTVSLLHPDGSTIASASIGTSGAFVDTKVLPVAGTYTIFVDPAGQAVGSVTTQLYNVVDVTGTMTIGGPSKVVTITSPGQNAKLTFAANASDRVSISLGSSTLSAAKVSLLKPDGTTQASTNIGTSGGSIPLQQLPVTGTYSIVVDPTADATGSVTVTLNQGPADIVGTIVPGGSPVNVTIGSPEQNARLSFSGTSGQRISLKLSNVTIGTSSCCSSKVSITNPDGTTLVSPTFVGTSGLYIDTKTLVQTGTYVILLDPQGSDVGSATLTLYDVPADASGTIVAGGSPVTTTVGTPGQNAALTFGGSAGQRVSLKLTAVTIGTSTCCSAKVSIVNPDGTTLVSPTFVGTSGGFVDAQTLAQTGTYRIVLDPQSSDTGSATLTLYDVPVDAGGPIVPGGSPVSVTVTTPGQNAKLSFDGVAGRRISVKLSNVTIGTSTCCSAKVSVVNPDGTTLVAPTNVGTTGGYVDTKTLAQSGVHTIVLDPQSSDIGSATVTLYDVPADASGTIVPGGAAVTLTMGTPGQNGRLTFAGSAGQRISVKLTGVTIGTSTCCSAKVSILNPDGTTLLAPTNVGTNGSFVDTKALAQTGTHTIVVDPQSSDTGSATVTLYDVGADAGGTLTAGGSPLTLTMATPGQNGNVTFAGSANQRISLKLSGVTIGTSTCCSAKVSILNPDGTTLVAATSFGTTGSFVDTKTLAQTGTYSIVVDPQSSDTGSVTLTLYDVPADVTGSVTVGGASLVVTLATPGQNGRITVDATAGQARTLTLSSVTIGTSTCCSAKVSILNPDGTTLVAPTSFGTSGKTVTFTPTATGTHTIVLDPQGSDTGSVTVKVT